MSGPVQFALGLQEQRKIVFQSSHAGVSGAELTAIRREGAFKRRGCVIEVADGRKRKLGPMWRRSEEGAKLVRVTGVVTDGVMGVSRFRILGEPHGVR